MRIWLILLLLLAFAITTAFGWHALAADPGYVLILLHETRVETSLPFAVIALILGALLLTLGWRLLRWPFRTWSRRTRRRGRERLAIGLLALIEGRYPLAQRELARVAGNPGLHAPAWLALSRAAHESGNTLRTEAALDEAATDAPQAALALRTRFQLERGEAQQALALLKLEATNDNLAPSAWRMLVEAALTCGDHAAARSGLAALLRSETLTTSVAEILEQRVLVASLAAASDTAALSTLWAGLSRSQRRIPEAVAAYARRGAELGQPLIGMNAIETFLRKNWSELLIRCYGELGPAEAETRLRNAEGWLRAQPNSVALLLTLGRLCRDQSLWSKAHEFLERGLAIKESATLWETLADCCVGEGDNAMASQCYSNALCCVRGETTQALPPTRHTLNGLLTQAIVVVEERSEHGVPHLRN